MICCRCAASLASGAPTCTSCGAEPLLVGTESGQGPYQLEAVLGQVGSSTTYRAVRLGDQRAVCIKALHPRSDLAADERALFVREARVLRQLRHPQIPSYLDSFISPHDGATSLVLVRELVEGEDLRRELECKRFREDEVLGILLSLLDVIDYLHALRPPVIHRDIKPTNVMRRTSDSALLLVDFGAVRDAVCDDLDLAALRMGCLGYIAPEQFEGNTSTATDLYALGVLAVELLSQRDPADMVDDDHQLDWRPHVEAHDNTIALLDALLRRPLAERPASAAAARRLVTDALVAQPRRDPLVLV